MYLKTANSFNLRTVLRVYLKFLSKNCKQATPYARPSPAIAGTSGQTSFGPLDLGSSPKKIGNLHCPLAVTISLSTKFN